MPRGGAIGPLTATLPVQAFDITNTTRSSPVYMQIKPAAGVAAMSACTKERFQLSPAENLGTPTTPSSKWAVPLPYGQWTVCFDNGARSRVVGSTITNSGPATNLVVGAPAPTTATTPVADLSTNGATAAPCT